MRRRVFLSHSGADSHAAIELKRLIADSPAGRDAGLEIWLDVDDGLRPGTAGWQAQIEEAIAASDAFCVYVGSRGIVNWVENEVRLGLSRATGDPTYPFVAALGPGVRSNALPPFARQHQATRDPLGDPDALQQLLMALLGNGTPPEVVDQPFVGLRAMGEEHAHLFFGREDETAELIALMRKHPLVAVVADSGAGKSSLVRAGLLPAFRGGALENENRPQPEDHLRHVVIMRPGADPLEGLRKGITAAAKALGMSGNDQAGLRRRVDLNDASETAYAIRCDLPVDETDTLLVVDQFEELLTQGNKDEARAFCDLLIALVDPGAQRGIRVVLTVRADFFNQISPYTALFERLTEDGHAAQMRLRQVSDKGLADLVAKPLRLAGFRDENQRDALIQALRRDLSDRPGDLALAQMALYESWKRKQQNGTDLVTAYEQVGGVRGALSTVAERVVAEELSPAQQELLFPLLVRLIRLGDTAGATRRAMKLADLDQPTADLADFLSGEAGGRLLAKTETDVEIGHEALIAQWPWLNQRVNENADDIRTLQRLSDAAVSWENAQKNLKMLANEGNQELFGGLAARHGNWLTNSERDFLARSRRRSRTKRRFRVAGISTVVILALLVAGIGLVAFRWGVDAQEQRRLAEIQSWNAQASELSAFAALSSASIEKDLPTDAVRFAAAGWPLRAKSPVPQMDVLMPQPRASMNALSEALPNARETARFVGHGADVTSVAYAIDDTRLVTGSWDRTARLWDVATGAQIRQFDATGPINAVALSPDGKLLATGSHARCRFTDDGPDYCVQLWDVDAGTEIRRFYAHYNPIYSVAFSHDGNRLASGSSDYTARLWDVTPETRIVSNGEEGIDAAETLEISLDGEKYLGEFKGHAGQINSLAFSFDGTMLATGSFDGSARIWDIESHEEIGCLDHGPGGVSCDPTFSAQATTDSFAQSVDVGVVNSVAFSSDDKLLVTGSGDRTARIWDIKTGEEIRKFSGHQDRINSIAISTDGKRIATASWDRTVRLWDVATGAEIARLDGHQGSVTAVAFSKGGTRLATGSEDDTARLWDVTRDMEIHRFVGHEAPVSSVAFSFDGALIATGSDDGTARIWQARGDNIGEQIESLSIPNNWVTSVAFSPDKIHLGIGSSDSAKGTLRILDYKSGEVALRQEGLEDPITGIVFSHDGNTLLAGTDSGAARLWDIAHREVSIVLRGHEAPVRSVAYSFDGSLLATGSDDGTARLWTAQGGEFPKLDGQDRYSVRSVAFSPDGALLATGSENGIVRLWDVDSKTERARLYSRDGQAVTSVVFSPVGRRLAIGSANGTARLLDMDTQVDIAVFGDGRSPVASLAFSPDGTRLAGGFDDGTVRLWDNVGLPISANALEIACRRLPFEKGELLSTGPIQVDRQTLEITAAICGEGYDPPLPWWAGTESAEPEPPEPLSLSYWEVFTQILNQRGFQ